MKGLMKCPLCGKQWLGPHRKVGEVCGKDSNTSLNRLVPGKGGLNRENDSIISR
jgi:hypothetical protein